MATRKLIVYPNKDLMIQAGAQRFVLALLDLLAERLPDGTHRTRVDVALSGGSAAQPLGLVLNDPLADAIDWSRVHFWWSDERFVPAYDTDRNALEARRLLLDQLVADGKLPESNIHEMAADTRSADDIADVMDQADSDDASVRAAADAANTYLMFLLDGDETGADKYLSLFCEKSKTAEEYVRRWIPIVAATRSVECGDSARDMLNGWISEN